ncbi:MAG: DUF429 domain-containing protein [candidate division Zixibacteria bacterium]|nr:DUF429 domain-containing protein [candidate division Zixibacteria bacterium]
MANPHPLYIETGQLYQTILELAQSDRLLVGIDAPLTLPMYGNSRECERRLRKQKIPVYPSGAPFFKPITLLGIDLKNDLIQAGVETIEIYPYASRVRLQVGLGVKKQRLTGRQRIQSDLQKYIPNLPSEPILDHNFLDALLGAYTTFLYGHGRAETISGDGQIVVPQSQRL